MFFYFFLSGIHGLLFEFCVVFTNMVADKYETLVVFMEGKKKTKITWCSWLGPRASAPASAPPLGPSLGTRWFHFFFFCISWIPPKFQFFLPAFSWIPPKIKKYNQWIPGPKNKKIWVVSHEIQHWRYFGQKKWFIFCAGLILIDVYVHVALWCILLPENLVV